VKDRKLLMIPGAIEFTPEVMQAMGMPTTSHVAPKFIEVFGQALERLGDFFLCPHGQLFVVAGSGSLAMDIADANLVEPGDKGIVINTSYLSDRMGAISERCGAHVIQAEVYIIVVVGAKGLGPAGVQDDELHTLDRPIPDARRAGLD